MPSSVTRLLDTVAPPHLGRAFRLLLASSLVSNLGDGIALAAGPLLVASLTSDPFLVSAAVLVQHLPTMLFGLFAGVFVDRRDRLRIVVLGNLLRALVVLGLVATIATGAVTIWVVLAVLFVLGCMESVVDLADGTLIPSVVPTHELGLANARTMASMLTCNQLLGPPIGAFLFAAGHAWPFVANAVTFAAGAMIVSRLAVPPQPRVTDGEDGPTVLQEAREGLRWLWRHDAVRTLVMTITVMNITWSAAWAVLVLWAKEQVGLSATGFGLLTTVSAIGGLISTSAFSWLTKRVTEATLMKVCLSLEVVMHLVMALTHAPWIAFVTMFVFGLYAFVWGTVSSTIRQRAVPDELRGRIGAVNMLGIRMGMVLGTPLGGLIARQWGLAAPFWFAFVGSGITVALVWRQLDKVAHAPAASPVASPAAASG